MDAQTFLDNFATIAEASGGVERLRKLVLGLAVSGKLSEPLPGDRTPSISGIAPASERPSRLPSHWLWAELRTIGPSGERATADGPFGSKLKTSDYVDQPGFRVLRLGNIGVGTFKDADRSYISESHFAELAGYHLRLGDVLVASLGNPCGRACLIPEHALPAVNKADCFRIRPHHEVNPRYLVVALNSPAALDRAAALNRGDTRGRITLSHLKQSPIPLPPLAEQERIVAKVDDLMKLCDDLEARQKRRHRATTIFRASALHALTEAETTADLRHAWKRVSSNWPSLTDSQDAIYDLRQRVVHLAVTGNLTSRRPEEGTADDLLQAASTNAGLDDPALADSEGVAVADPHPLPPTWRWVSLGSVVSEVLAGWSAPSTQRRRSGDEWAVLKVSACTWGSFRPDENKALKPGTAPRENLEVRVGDLLITRANTSDLVARSVVVDSTPPRLMLSDKTLRLTPVPGCNPRYLNLANLAAIARAHYRSEATGTSDSMKNVSQRAIRRTPIPLPPSAEQDRIVATVDRLTKLCDDLSTALAEQERSAERLASAAAS